jgi:hypothetical protein
MTVLLAHVVNRLVRHAAQDSQSRGDGNVAKPEPNCIVRLRCEEVILHISTSLGTILNWVRRHSKSDAALSSLSSSSSLPSLSL